MSSRGLDLGPMCWHRRWGEEEAKDARQPGNRKCRRGSVGRTIKDAPNLFIKTGAGSQVGKALDRVLAIQGVSGVGVGPPIQDPTA